MMRRCAALCTFFSIAVAFASSPFNALAEPDDSNSIVVEGAESAVPAEPALANPVLTTLYRFNGVNNNNNGGDGGASRGSLVFGPDGSIYGTTYYGGGFCDGGCGVIFRLKPNGSGFSESVLRLKDVNFGNGLNGGYHPAAGMIFHNGALYGTMSVGGDSAHLPISVGTVFKVIPPPAGSTKWTLQVLFRFRTSAASPGDNTPIAGVVFGADGSLYGTTSTGGPATSACGAGCGTIYKLTPGAPGKLWTRTVLHRFTGGGVGHTGDKAQGTLVFGKDGALYGTTASGGRYNRGTVFRLAKSGASWKLTVLHNFTGGNISGGLDDGNSPLGTVVLGTDGSVYGATQTGGKFGKGTVFKLKRPTSGTVWTHTILHHMGSMANDGDTVNSGLYRDAFNAIYGTTSGGGASDGGTVFKLSPAGSSFAYKMLHSFAHNSNGYDPMGGVIAKGKTLYGTTTKGGGPGPFCASACGTVFKLQQ